MHLVCTITPITRMACTGEYDLRTKRFGINLLTDQVNAFCKLSKEKGKFDTKRIKQDIDWLYKTIEQEVGHLMYNNPNISDTLTNLKVKSLKESVRPIVL